MSPVNNPLVSVLTPVYNGETFLAECIESVLAQTYQNFEYVILNNCSTDQSLEIARSYAKRDSRIRVHTNDSLVPVIENHNRAFNMISPAAKYCKVVSADDTIYPDCLESLVGLAESEPSVGFVGCYQQSGNSVRWQGFPYPRHVIPGRDVCQWILSGKYKYFGFGSPTSLLYRADIVRSSSEFYPDPSPHSDTSACFKHLRDSDFGFVYRVLCWERTHEHTQTHKSSDINRYASAYLNDLLRYGPWYLNEAEFKRSLARTLDDYYGFLAVNAFRSRGKEFWDYHRARLRELGYPVTNYRLLKAALRKISREILNPAQAMAKLRNHGTAAGKPLRVS